MRCIPISDPTGCEPPKDFARRRRFSCFGCLREHRGGCAFFAVDVLALYAAFGRYLSFDLVRFSLFLKLQGFSASLTTPTRGEASSSCNCNETSLHWRLPTLASLMRGFSRGCVSCAYGLSILWCGCLRRGGG